MDFVGKGKYDMIVPLQVAPRRAGLGGFRSGGSISGCKLMVITGSHWRSDNESVKIL